VHVWIKVRIEIESEGEPASISACGIFKKRVDTGLARQFVEGIPSQAETREDASHRNTTEPQCVKLADDVAELPPIVALLPNANDALFWGQVSAFELQQLQLVPDG